MKRLVPLLLPLLLVACATFQEGPTDIPIPKEASFVDVDGWRIHVQRIGDQGPPLLLVHGYSSTLFEWLKVVPGLCASHRCLLVDLPGFGWSDKRAGDYSPQALGEVLYKLLDHYDFGPTRVIAHSWGASVALSLALAHPKRVERLVLVGAWVYYEQLPSLMKWARVPGLGEAIFTLFFDEQVEMRYEQIYFEPDKHVSQQEVEIMNRFLDRAGVVRAALQAARDQRLEEIQESYPRVTQPTLLVWGEEDRVALPFYGRRLAADLPHARLVFMPRCGHVPHHEDPASFVGHVRPFLQGKGEQTAEVQP